MPQKTVVHNPVHLNSWRLTVFVRRAWFGLQTEIWIATKSLFKLDKVNWFCLQIPWVWLNKGLDSALGISGKLCNNLRQLLTYSYMVHIRKMFATFLMFGRSLSLGSLTKCLFHVFLYLHYQKTDRFEVLKIILTLPYFLCYIVCWKWWEGVHL